MLLSRLQIASFSYPFTAFVPALAAGLTIDRRASFQADQLAPAAAPLNGASAKARTKAVLHDVSDVGQRKRDGHESLPLHRFSSRDAFLVVHSGFALCLCSSAVELSIAPSSWF